MKQNEKPTVALIFGGRGFEHDVSVEGAKFMLPLIDTERFNPLPVLITKRGEWLTLPLSGDGNRKDTLSRRVTPIAGENTSAPHGLCDLSCEFIPVDLAIPLLHGDHGEDGEISAVLESAGIPYVGCDVISGAVAIDKVYTKILAKHLDIPIAPFRLLTLRSEPTDSDISECESELGYPMFIKPARLGSSFGASSAGDRTELKRALREAHATGEERILVEKKVQIMRELECAYLSVPDQKEVYSIGEIRVGASYDFNKKYLDTSSVTLNPHPELPGEIRSNILRYTQDLAALIGVRDLSRFDFFEDSEGNILFNELNTFPGFTASSMFPMLMEVEGITNKELISLLISAALSRAK